MVAGESYTFAHSHLLKLFITLGCPQGLFYFSKIVVMENFRNCLNYISFFFSLFGCKILKSRYIFGKKKQMTIG